MRLASQAVVALLLAGLPASAAAAASLEVRLPLVAARQAWKSRVDSFNPSDFAASAVLQFVAPDGTAVPGPAGNIPAKGSLSVSVGATTGTPFKGAAVLSSDQPLASVCRQAGTGTAQTVPTYYAGLDPSSAGATRIFLPLAVRSGSLRTAIGVQNVGTVSAPASLSFFGGDAVPVTVFDTPAIPPGASSTVDLSQVKGLPRGFDGSVVVTSAGPVAAAAEVLASRGPGAFAFTALPGTADTLLVPEAGCVTSGGRTSASLLAVQNAAAVDARITATYFFPVRRPSGVAVRAVSMTTALTPPGARRTINPCRKRALRGKRKVVAVLSAHDGAGVPTPLAAVTRWTRGVAGTRNAYTDPVPPGIGAGLKYRVVLPSVPWARRTGERATVAVMNAAPAAGDPAAPITVTATFYPAGGAPVSRDLTVYTGRSLSASSAKALSGGSFRGGLVLESASPIAAAAGVRLIGSSLGDGYAGLPW